MITNTSREKWDLKGFRLRVTGWLGGSGEGGGREGQVPNAKAFLRNTVLAAGWTT